MTPHEMTLAALAETNQRVHAALDAAGANRAGNPLLGLLGFMWIDGDLEDLVRAADLAHTSNRTPGWAAGDTDQIITYIRRDGLWKNTPAGRAFDKKQAALDAYCAHISSQEPVQ